MKTQTQQPQSSSYDFTAGKLPILVSARVRLNPEQKAIIKEAYNKKKEELVPSSAPTMPGSTVQTVTNWNVEKQLNMPDFVFRDIFTSRDSISLSSVLTISNSLGVEVLSKEDVLKACKSYVDYVWQKSKDQ